MPQPSNSSVATINAVPEVALRGSRFDAVLRDDATGPVRRAATIMHFGVQLNLCDLLRLCIVMRSTGTQMQTFSTFERWLGKGPDRVKSMSSERESLAGDPRRLEPSLIPVA
jgi:hypothetical protein